MKGLSHKMWVPSSRIIKSNCWKKQATDHQNCPHSRTCTDYIPTTVLNSKCLTNVSPTNSSNQTRDQTPFFIRPKRPQKIERWNTITIESSHNISTNSPQSLYNSGTCSTNEQNQTPCPLYYLLWVSYYKLQSKQKKKLA